MYAAVKAGPKGLLISNDVMRDHLFQLLAPKFFHKWQQRHQASILSPVLPSCKTVEMFICIELHTYPMHGQRMRMIAWQLGICRYD